MDRWRRRFGLGDNMIRKAEGIAWICDSCKVGDGKKSAVFIQPPGMEELEVKQCPYCETKASPSKWKIP